MTVMQVAVRSASPPLWMSDVRFPLVQYGLPFAPSNRRAYSGTESGLGPN